MTALAWYATGTVAVTNGSAVVTGTSTLWMANVDAGQGFIGPDFSTYEIASVDSDTQMTLRTNYRGTTVASGGAYVIQPVQGYTRSAAVQLAALMLAAASLINLAPNNNDIIQEKGGTWATRSPLQYFLDLCSNLTEATVPSAGTCDIGVATSPKVLITGSNTITSFGTSPNCHRWVRFSGTLVLTHNATTLILPGGVNVITAPGDTAIFVSDNSGNWRCFNYQPASGQALRSTLYLTPQMFGAIGDGASHQLSAGDVSAHSASWLQLHAAGDEWDTVGLIEWILHCAAGSSVPGANTVVWNSNIPNLKLNVPGLCPAGSYLLNKQLKIIGQGLDLKFMRQSSLITWTGPSNITPILFNSITFASAPGLTVTTNVPLNDGLALVSLDYDGTATGLKTQQLTLVDWVINGNLLADYGVAIQPSGGNLQADTIQFHNIFLSNCLRAGVKLTSHNAIGNQFYGGDAQNNPRCAIDADPGQVNVYGFHAENEPFYLQFSPPMDQILCGGADVQAWSVDQNGSSVNDLRSESDIAFIGNSGAANVGHNIRCWAPGASSDPAIMGVPWSQNVYYLPGHYANGGTKGKTFKVVDVGGDPKWYHITSVAGSPSVITVTPNPGWTANQWHNYVLRHRFSNNGYTEYLVIDTNTANTLTLRAGAPFWGGTFNINADMVRVTGFPNVTSPAFDSAPQGYSTPPVPIGTGQGFTTTAGSTSVTTNGIVSWINPIHVNDYVIIPDCKKTGPGVAGFKDYRSALIAKVTAISGTGPYTLTLSDTADFSLTDTTAYWAAPFTDSGGGGVGVVQYMEVDYNSFANLVSLSASGANAGRLGKVTSLEGGFEAKRADFLRLVDHNLTSDVSYYALVVGDTGGTIGSALCQFRGGSGFVIVTGSISGTGTAGLSGNPGISLPPLWTPFLGGSGTFAAVTGLTHQAGYTQWVLQPQLTVAGGSGLPYASIMELGSANTAAKALLANMAGAWTLNFTIIYS